MILAGVAADIPELRRDGHRSGAKVQSYNSYDFCCRTEFLRITGSVRFWDASAIAPLLMTEATTRAVQTLAAKDAAMLERLDGFDILTTLRTAHRFTNDIAAR